MPKQMTIIELKKRLRQLEQNELIEMILGLYKSNGKVKEITNAKFMGEKYVLEVLEDYKQKMYGIFFPKNMRTLPSLKVAKKLISDFEKVGNEVMVLDLMLYYVECGNEFTNEFGDIDGPFYDSLCGVFGKFVDRLNSQENYSAYHEFKERIDNLINSSAHIGWGYGDYIFDKAFKIQWYEEE